MITTGRLRLIWLLLRRPIIQRALLRVLHLRMLLGVQRGRVRRPGRSRGVPRALRGKVSIQPSVVLLRARRFVPPYSFALARTFCVAVDIAYLGGLDDNCARHNHGAVFRSFIPVWRGRRSLFIDFCTPRRQTSLYDPIIGVCDGSSCGWTRCFYFERRAII